MEFDSHSLEQPPAAPESTGPTFEQRASAFIEVVLCSDFPTQMLVALTLAALGFAPQSEDGHLRLGFVAALSMIDTALLVGLMWFFLTARGDRPADVFLGSRSPRLEARAGLPMIVVAFVIAAAVLLTLRAVAPSLHNVPDNPFQELMHGPSDAVLFALVAVVAGGIREELQRAFLLNRFERFLGGSTVGVIVTSAAFGAGHLQQGADAALATGLLGAYWAIVYLRRRSVVAPMVSHAGFNLLQLAQLMALDG